MKRLLLLVSISLYLSGCATFSPSPETIKTLTDSKIHAEIRWRDRVDMDTSLYKQEIVSRHIYWPDAVKQDILKGIIKIGMTKDQVLASWGKPDDINKTVTQYNTHEQWVYNSGSYYSRYLYFDGDQLTSWQE